MVKRARAAGVVTVCITGANDPPGWGAFATGAKA
jgi:hypothetical protein